MNYDMDDEEKGAQEPLNTTTGLRALPVGSHLNNGLDNDDYIKYKIDKVLGVGGFGIVYKATAFTRNKNGRALMKEQKHCAIKEFFYGDCERSETLSLVDLSESSYWEAKKRFRTEAKMLHKFDIPNVVNVNECFSQNNTFYYVMQFVEGDNLEQYVEKKGALNTQDALAIMTPIIEAVELLHDKELYHLDIKPDNIMLGDDGGQHDKYVRIEEKDYVPILIDFGTLASSKKFDLKYKTACYSPPEQSYPDQFNYKNGVDRKRLDVFALGATMYFLLTGTTPPDAPSQFGQFDEFIKKIEKELSECSIDDGMKCAIVKAMNPNRDQRTQSAHQFLKELGTGEALDAKKARLKKKQRRNAILYLLAIALVGVAAYYAWYNQQDDVVNNRRIQAAIENGDKVVLTEYASLDSLRAINELVTEYEKDNNILMAWYWAEYVKEHQDSISGDKAVIKALIARSEVLRKNLIEKVDTTSVAYKSLSQLLDSTAKK